MKDSGDTLFAPADDDLVGRVIAGKFALRCCVGVGASGTVYQADQSALGRTVAIKILRPELAADPRFVRRFNDEAMAASRLNHPNVVSVIDFGQTEDGLLYLVMEFLRGSTLTHVLRSEELASERIADILTQILSALEEAHEAGVVHADLKADNIIVEHRRGGWDLAKVVDFGIARLVGREDPDERAICGTPEYMAPEVIRGQDPTFAADIYAVGILLYELMTGATPFAGGNSMDVLRKHLDSAPIPPSERCPDRAIHPVLEEAALRALAKDPRARFRTATEMREHIAAVLSLAPEVDQVLCSACGTRSERSKFCPECGEARERPERVAIAAPPAFGDETPTADLSAEELAYVLESSAAQKPTTEPIEPGGILPLPVVGRDAELARLETFLQGPAGASLHLAGPLGCGRTCLLREASERAAARGALVYVAGPDPSGLGTPFYPVRSLLAAILDLPSVCSYDELGAALERIGLSRRDLPGLGELFGHRGDLWQLEPEIRRRELLAATIRVLRTVGRQHPATLAFEDVDRYDQPSLDLLRRLAQSNQRAPAIRLLATSRDALQLDWPALERIELGAIDDEALRALVAHFSTRGHPDLVSVEELRDKAGSMPGHVHQLVRFGVEGGDAASAPSALADLVAARLDLLTPHARQALQAMAALGMEGTREALGELLLGSLRVSEVEEAVSVLIARGHLRDDGGLLSFSRAFVRDVVYESTPVHVRRRLHERAAEHLGSVAEPAVVGAHAHQAGQLRRAAELLSRGGDSAAQQLDDLGAAALYNRALAAARQLMLEDNDPSHRVRFVSTSIKLADSLRAAGEAALARGILDEAAGHCLESPTLRAQLLRASALLSSSSGRVDDAIEILREAIGLLIPLGVPDGLCDLYVDLATMQLRAGSPADAIRELEEGIDLVTLGEGARVDRGPRNLWALVLRLAQLCGTEGKTRHALALAEHAHRHANKAGSVLGAARVQSLLAGLHEQLGDYARADIYRRRAIEAMRGLGDRRGTAELLLSGSRATSTMRRITPASIREARVLAEEVGWSEGVRRARRASKDPPSSG